MNKLFNITSNTFTRIIYGLITMILVVGASGSSMRALKLQSLPVDNSFITDTWAVQVAPGTDPELLARQLGVENMGPVGKLTDIYLFRLPGSDSDASAMADILAANGQVKWFEQQVARQLSPRDPADDPSYPTGQWYLHDSSVADINVEGAWGAGYTGTGVTIGIVDDGLQHTHPDLSGHYANLVDWDFNDNDNDPGPSIDSDFHGTSVAGVAAANDNTACGVGVAYNASLAGLRLTAASTTDAQQADALNYKYGDISIYNNSWGPADDGLQLGGPGPLTLAALQNGVTNGRTGKGSIYVWSAGNGLLNSDDVNYDGYANSRFVMAVGAVKDDGEQAAYSEPGAAMFVTAPSSGGDVPNNGVASVDLMGVNGYNSSDCATDIGNVAAADSINGVGTYKKYNFGGTSSSAPLVSGVVALMLEANPLLRWRDVQHILAATAVQNDPTDPDWYTNAAGFHVNHKYGFGLVDAAAAVNAALTWTNVASEVNVSSGIIPVAQEIPDFPAAGLTRTFNVTQDFELEHVEVVFSATHTFRGDLRLVLTSPSGTQSILAEQHNDQNDNYISWKFMTVRNWGESSAGVWTLEVKDVAGFGGGSFDSWQLNLYGEAAPGTFADVDVTIGGDLQGSYTLLQGQSRKVVYDLDNGPVKVQSLGGEPIVAALRDSLIVNGGLSTFSQLMGIPDEQISDTYWFPAYVNNTVLNGQLRFANVGVVDTTVTVTIGGVIQDNYLVHPNEMKKQTYALDAGPVKVQSSGGVPIVAALRDALIVNNALSTFSQVMGIPDEELSDTYWFPAYVNNTVLNGQLRFANVGVADTTVTVTIGGVIRGTYLLHPNEMKKVVYDLDLGPVKVQSSGGVPIVAALRDALIVNNALSTFSQIMGLPDDQLSDTYWIPAYVNNSVLNGQLRFGNVGGADTTVTVTIGGVDRGSYLLHPNENKKVVYDLDTGPVKLQSTGGVPIVGALRDALIVNNALSTFSQMMGLPDELLSDTYWIPAYVNNTVLNGQLRFGVP